MSHMIMKNSVADKILLAMKEAGYEYAYINLSSIRGCNADGDWRSDDLPDINGWPATWAIAKKFKDYSGGCGNSHQRQMRFQIEHFGWTKELANKYPGRLEWNLHDPFQGGAFLHLKEYKGQDYDLFMAIFS